MAFGRTNIATSLSKGISKSITGRTQGLSFLFADGTEGVWYDIAPQYAYQDSAGTTAASVGDPVGLLLDRSQGLVFGPQITYASFVDASTAPSTATYENEELTLTANAATSRGRLSYSVTPGFHRISWRRSGGTADCTLDIGSTAGGSDIKAVNNVTTTATSVVVYVPASTLWLNFYRGGTETATVGSVSVAPYSGHHATQSTAASRPILRQDAGGRYYLEFGTSKFLVTPSIDFTATDKMFVCAGVRKASDAAIEMVAEFSSNVNNNAGAFALWNGSNTGGAASYRWVSRGTSISTADPGFGYASPISNVLTGIGEISTDTALFRIDGVQAGSSTTDQGTGNFGNYPIYIGMRGGSSLPFNGRLYSLTVAGKQATDAEIQRAESFTARKTGVSL